MKKTITNKNDISSFYKSLKEEFTVYGVKEKEKGFYVFDETDEFSDPLDDYIPTILPPKKYLFPQQETLLRFDTQPHPDIQPVIESKKQVLFGVRPCDIHGINLLDKIFSSDHEDINYTSKRKETVIIGMNCLKPCYEHANCASVGCLDVDKGHDIMITDIGDIFYLSINTPMGEKIIEKYTTSVEVSSEDINKFEELMKEREDKFEMKFNTDVSRICLRVL